MKEPLKLCDDNLWHKINEIHGTKGGVYKIVSMEGQTIIPINRFLDTDKEGILYIGKADCFTNRVIDCKKTIWSRYSSGAHIGGRRYRKNTNISAKFPEEKLFVILEETENPLQLERKYLDDYFNKFGEVPPLNAI